MGHIEHTPQADNSILLNFYGKMKCLLILVLISICQGRPADDTDELPICKNENEEEVPCAFDFDEDGVQVRLEETASVDDTVIVCKNDKEEVAPCTNDEPDVDGKTAPVDIPCHNDEGVEVECNLCPEGEDDCEQSQAKHIDPAECRNDVGEIVECCIDEDTKEVVACERCVGCKSC